MPDLIAIMVASVAVGLGIALAIWLYLKWEQHQWASEVDSQVAAEAQAAYDAYQSQHFWRECADVERRER
jgi:hypothetical protein